MAESISVRITLPYSDCSGIVKRWFDRAHRAVCYEHEADDEIKQTHIHIALLELNCKAEALKRMWKDAPGKGNEFWSLTPVRDESKYLTYMTKGKLRPVLVKNFSSEQLEEHRLSWVEPTLGNDKNGNSPLEYYINQVLKRFERIKSRSDMPTGRYDDYGHLTDDMLLDEVRSETMKVFWGENRRVPHASMYKQVAGSVYLNLMERIDCLDMGIASLKHLWY